MNTPETLLLSTCYNGLCGLVSLLAAPFMAVPGSPASCAVGALFVYFLLAVPTALTVLLAINSEE